MSVSCWCCKQVYGWHIYEVTIRSCDLEEWRHRQVTSVAHEWPYICAFGNGHYSWLAQVPSTCESDWIIAVLFDIPANAFHEVMTAPQLTALIIWHNSVANLEWFSSLENYPGRIECICGCWQHHARGPACKVAQSKNFISESALRVHWQSHGWHLDSVEEMWRTCDPM